MQDDTTNSGESESQHADEDVVAKGREKSYRMRFCTVLYVALLVPELCASLSKNVEVGQI